MPKHYRVIQNISEDDGSRHVMFYLLDPPCIRYVNVLSRESEETIEHDIPLPGNISSYFTNRPHVQLSMKGDEPRVIFFDIADWSILEGPVSNVAEMRKHLKISMIDYIADAELTPEEILSIDDHIKFLLDTKNHVCGCGCMMDTVGENARRCDNCHAYMCVDCLSSVFCDGCFQLLQEVDSDDEDDDDFSFN